MGEGQARPAGIVAGFDGGKPGGFDGEAGGCMEVSDEGTNTGEVVDIGCGGGCGPLGGNGWVVLGAKKETPKSDSALLAPIGEEDGVVLGKDCYTMFFEEDFATVVKELADFDEVVFKSGNNLGVVDR